MKRLLSICTVLAATGFGWTAFEQTSVGNTTSDAKVTSLVLRDAVPVRTVANNLADWRYRWYNGQWWYWLPSNRWTYYSGGAWRDYAPGYRSGSVYRNPAPYRNYYGPRRYYSGYRGDYYYRPYYRGYYRDGWYGGRDGWTGRRGYGVRRW